MRCFEDLARSHLLLLDELLRVVLSNVSYAFSTLPDEFLEHQIVSSRLHVVSIRLNETSDLFRIKVITVAIFLCELLNDVTINGNRMESNYYAAVVLHVYLRIPFVLADFIYFNALSWVCI